MSSERTGHSKSPSRRRLVRRGSLAQREAAHEIFEPRAGAHRRARAEAAAGQRKRPARRVREVVVRDELRGVGQVGDGCGVEDNFERLLAGHDARADAAAFGGALEQQLPVAQVTPSCSLKPKMCFSRLRTRCAVARYERALGVHVRELTNTLLRNSWIMSHLVVYWRWQMLQ